MCVFCVLLGCELTLKQNTLSKNTPSDPEQDIIVNHLFMFLFFLQNLISLTQKPSAGDRHVRCGMLFNLPILYNSTLICLRFNSFNVDL